MALIQRGRDDVGVPICIHRRQAAGRTTRGQRLLDKLPHNNRSCNRQRTRHAHQNLRHPIFAILRGFEDQVVIALARALADCVGVC